MIKTFLTFCDPELQCEQFYMIIYEYGPLQYIITTHVTYQYLCNQFYCALESSLPGTIHHGNSTKVTTGNSH